MDKKEFVEQLIQDIRNKIAVSSIVSTRINLVSRGSSHKGLCPFHADRTIGSFVVTDRKGIWKCFSCGVGGDGIKFISIYDNIDYLEASFNIGLEFNIISIAEYEEYFSRRRYTPKDIKKIERKYSEIDKGKMKEDRAEDKALNDIYNIFSECCSLSDEHYSHLKNVRKIPEYRIESDYFTFPTRRILINFIRKIKAKGYNEEVLKKIPGFYFDIKSKHMTFVKHKGLGIKIRNEKGEAVGIQIRRDKKFENRSRYIWFSSAFANLDEENRFSDGTGSGSPIDVVYPKKIKNPIIAITEGRFKAEKLAELGFISISVQGVGNWRGITKAIKYIKNIPLYSSQCEKFKKQFKTKNIPLYICFDADMKYNYQVFQQAKKMSDMLSDFLLDNELLYVHWDDALGKGIDDLINNGHMKAIKKFRKKSLDDTFEKIYLDILNEKKYLNISDVTQDVIDEYILKYKIKEEALTKIMEEPKYKKVNDIPKEVLKKYFEENVKLKVVGL